MILHYYENSSGLIERPSGSSKSPDPHLEIATLLVSKLSLSVIHKSKIHQHVYFPPERASRSFQCVNSDYALPAHMF